jgi:hypothetical protein
MKVRLLLPQPISFELATGISIDSKKKKEVVGFEDMFIRFVGAEIDERSHVAAGLFCAASQLRWSESLPDYEFDALSELKDWFNVHLASPFDRLPRDRRYEQAVCWFGCIASFPSTT